jgi:hypothetical protein
VIAKIGVGSPENWHLLVRSIHQLPVPKETKQEHKTERSDKCDEEFFPVHNVFSLRFRSIPRKPEVFIAKWACHVDLKSYEQKRLNRQSKI